MPEKYTPVIFMIFALAFLSIPARAADFPGGFYYDKDTCFERVYSNKHLRKHPRQRVAMIRFNHYPKLFGLIGKDDIVDPRLSPGVVYFQIQVRFRGAKRTGSNSGTCEVRRGKLICQIECDGGSFQIIRESTDSLLIRNDRFAVTGCENGEETCEDGYFSHWVEPEPDDKAFRLKRLPHNRCIAPLPGTVN